LQQYIETRLKIYEAKLGIFKHSPPFWKSFLLI